MATTGSATSGKAGASKETSPRDLDPKFKDAQVPQDADRQDSSDIPQESDGDVPVERREETNPEKPFDPDEKFIVHRQQYTDNDGNVQVKEHGPMPVAEWADYSREHNL